jgi:DNA adenine methylase
VTPAATAEALEAPFPWFGGKRRAAPLVWSRLGDVANYIEPFAGSLAVLLGRPHAPGIETINDRDCYLANFWRAVRGAPELVAWWADWPVSEADLHARHEWLVNQSGFRERMAADPEYFDPKIAGWWVWGIAQWSGPGWCDRADWIGRYAGSSVPRGIHARRFGDLDERFHGLADRLATVRVCAGDWARVIGPGSWTPLGLTGIFLDPPYAGDAAYQVYNGDSMFLAHEVAEWAVRHGDDERLRIAFCGYAGEHQFPASWECVAWKAHGGYGSKADGRGRANAERERIWFSPACLRGSDV